MPVIDAVLERLKSLHPKVIDLALDRIERLLTALDNPHHHLPPVVHVAGTNGKGSTLAYLRAMAEAAGLSVHVYTSPHLVRFAERIRVAGQIISDDALSAILHDCERLNAGHPITFFEITTAAAFLAFQRTPADLCLLETGLGGRVDATNVIDRPALTILAPISLDHQAFLGGTVAAIAAEKAGIMKAGVPCVSATQEPAALHVIMARAEELGSPLLLEGRDWTVERNGFGLMLTMGNDALALPFPVLPGPHQIHNAGLAAAAALTLNRLLPNAQFHRRLSNEAIADGLRNAQWPARLQHLNKGPLIDLLPGEWELWLDGGHNPAAGEILARVAQGWKDRPVDLVVGMLNTKDSRGFLAPLAPHVRSVQTVAIPGEANSLSAEQVAGVAESEGILAQAAPSVAAAVRTLAKQDGPARILICGSLYLAGTVLADNG